MCNYNKKHCKKIFILTSFLIFDICKFFSSACPHPSSDDYPEIKKLFPAADIQFIPDASHWIHADKPLDFISSVSSFLQS